MTWDSASASDFQHAPGVVVLFRKDSPHHHHHHDSSEIGLIPAHYAKGILPSSQRHQSPSLVPSASIAPGYVRGRPVCARELDLCVHNHDYPLEKVQAILDRHYNHMYDLYHTLYKTPPHDVHWYENSTTRYIEKHPGSFTCRSETLYLRLGWAKNWKGHWMAVVNTERFPQYTRIEKCKYKEKPCDYMVPCYKSSCKQREMLYPLISVNPYDPGLKPSIELFPIPSGCSCYVEEYHFHK